MRASWLAFALPLAIASVVGSAASRGQESEDDAGTASTSQAVPSGPPAGASDEERLAWLRAAIDRAVSSRPELARASVAIHAVDVETGRELYARAANDSMNVASNVKIVTVAAALSALGPEYRWQTSLYAEKWDGRDRIQGDLVLVAGGDPSLTHHDLGAIAEELTRQGVKRIDGSLVIDDGFFDGSITPPAFGQKREDGAFRAPVSAASVNYNAVTLRIQPGAASGDPARVEAIPSSAYVELANDLVTVDEGRTRIDVATRAVPGTPARLQIEVSGTIRSGADVTWLRRRVDDPVEFLGESLRAALADRGVKIAGRRIERRAVSPTARALVVHQSEPLGVLVRELNKASNNFMAETVLKTLGAQRRRPGTWNEGLAAVREWLTSAGIPEGTYRYDNGSGLYDSNRFTAAQMTAILRAAARDFRISAELTSSLAIAGVDGTLRSRMNGRAPHRWVRGKTGTLRDVTCLTGYAAAPGATPIAFAVLVNQIPDKVDGAGKAARALQDDVAEALALYQEPRDR